MWGFRPNKKLRERLALIEEDLGEVEVSQEASARNVDVFHKDVKNTVALIGNDINTMGRAISGVGGTLIRLQRYVYNQGDSLRNQILSLKAENRELRNAIRELQDGHNRMGAGIDILAASLGRSIVSVPAKPEEVIPAVPEHLEVVKTKGK